MNIFFVAGYGSNELHQRSNWMILERLEPKKSKKVAVGVPGRPFEVAKGVLSAPRFGFSQLPELTWRKNVTLLEKSGSERNDLFNSSELLKRSSTD